jgi:proline iminopeptidase
MNDAKAQTSKVIDADWVYPVHTLNNSGLLQVDDNPPYHAISWKEYGDPNGEPVIFLHGGPGGGCDEILTRLSHLQNYAA